MRITISGLLLSTIALAELCTWTNSLKARWSARHLREALFQLPKRVIQESLQLHEDCHTTLDLVIALDGSTSVSRNQFSEIRHVTAKLLTSLPVSPRNVHVALIVFGTAVSTEWDYTDPESRDANAAAARVLKIPQPGGSTNTAGALEAAYKILFKKKYGAREAVPKVLVLLTDGESDNPPKTRGAAEKLRSSGTLISVLGIGRDVDSKECRAMVGCHRENSGCPLFLRSAYALSLISLFTLVCKSVPQDAVCGPWTPWSSCSVTCGKGTQVSYREELSPATSGTPTCSTCSPLQGLSCAENGGLVRTQECSEVECDVDGGCGEWDSWSSWSATCGYATRTRRRTQHNETSLGAFCDSQNREEGQIKYLGSCDEAEVSKAGINPGGGGGHSEGFGQSTDPNPYDDRSNSDGQNAGGLFPSEEKGSGRSGSHGEGSSDYHQQQPDHQENKELPDKGEGGGVPAIAIAGGIIGALFLASAGAGVGYYYYKGRGSARKAQPAEQYDNEANAKDITEAEKEAMISVSEESNMWVDR